VSTQFQLNNNNNNYYYYYYYYYYLSDIRRIEVTGRRERRRRKLLDYLKERREYSHLKEEAVDSTRWRARFRRGFVPVVRQTAK
jgi:hypothetical protein